MGHIFISYSHNDSRYAHQLADSLQAEGFDVWIDARIDYGAQWPYEIQKQLDSCDAFILIMTPRSFASEWAQSELQRAKRKLKPIFPLLLEGDEPWLSVESTQYYDVRGETSPDANFYSALGRVVSRQAGQAVPLPAAGGIKPLKQRSRSLLPKMRTEILIAIVGALATLLVVATPILWSSLSERANPPLTDNVTSPTLSAEETQASAAVTEPPVEASEIPNPSDIPMVLIPAGGFTMGSDNVDEALAECQSYYSGCDSSWFIEEQPAHTVYLDDFYIDVYEVTNSLYAECVNAAVCEPPTYVGSETRESYYNNSEFEHYPVIFVDWNMAETYCEWRAARLPTEAEWEKAARGDDGRIYPWGDELDPAALNFNQEIGDTVEAGNYDEGTSPYGLYDMAGNVWEWVADYYSGTYYQDSPSSNPPGPEAGQAHVLRGGSWYDPAFLSRATSRLKEPEPVGNNFGFRCARDP